MTALSNAEKRRARIRLLVDLMRNEHGKNTEQSNRRCLRVARDLADLFKEELAFHNRDSSAMPAFPPGDPESPRKPT